MSQTGKNIIKRLGSFDEPYLAFELLETEHGTPKGSRRSSRKTQKEPQPERVSPKLAENEARIRTLFRADINSDLILRPFRCGGRTAGLAVFLNGMADDDSINDFILRPAMRCSLSEGREATMTYLEMHVLEMQEVTLTDDFTACVTAITEGQTAVFLSGDTDAAIMDTRGFASRSVPESNNEQTAIGPKEAFTENIRTNITLLRRIVKTPDFVCEFRDAGAENRVRLAVAYREGVANPRLVCEVKRRLAAVDTRMLLSGGTLEQLVEEHPYSPVPQTLLTERPDRAAAGLMQGRVVLLMEGSPQASVLPVTLSMLLSTPEDAYMRQPVGTVIRIVRAFGAVISVLLPAYYLALALHHQGMMSSEVLSTVVASRTLVFLPMPVEMIFLLLIFQLVREAGMRVPGAVGQTVGIIGGLILGQAAVAANVISTVALVIVALTGLGNFAVPNYNLQVSVAYFRILLCLVAALGGLLGLGCALLVSIAYLSSLKSWGQSYLAPFAPVTYRKAPFLVRGRVSNDTRAPDEMNTVEAGA